MTTSVDLVDYCSNLISWKSPKQREVAKSSNEAEYKDLANIVVELSWINYLLT